MARFVYRFIYLGIVNYWQQRDSKWGIVVYNVIILKIITFNSIGV